MPNLNIRLQGMDKLRAGMKRAPTVVRRHIGEGLQESVIELEATARRESPIDTGRLKAAHRTSVDKLRLRGEVTNVTKYATAVHEGSSPHVIRPRRKKALSWPGARHPVKKVNHPGFKGDPWFERTVKKKRGKVERIMQKSVNRALKKIF